MPFEIGLIFEIPSGNYIPPIKQKFSRHSAYKILLYIYIWVSKKVVLYIIRSEIFTI